MLGPDANVTGGMCTRYRGRRIGWIEGGEAESAARRCVNKHEMSKQSVEQLIESGTSRTMGSSACLRECHVYSMSVSNDTGTSIEHTQT